MSRPQGYGLSLGQLDDAVETATGISGFLSLMVEMENPDRPVYAARVVGVLDPPQGTPTHLLHLELRGTPAAISVPLLETDTNAWSIVSGHPDFDLSGTVTQGEATLTIHLEEGEIETLAGTLTLDETTLVLSALGDQQ